MGRSIRILGALALVAAACGGDTAEASDVASIESAGSVGTVAEQQVAVESTEEEALIAFTACLRDNGIDMADPTVDSQGNVRLSPPSNLGGGDFDRESAQVAREECQDLLGGVTLGFAGNDQTGFQDSLLTWAACMRDNGYDMADPDISGFVPGQGGRGGNGGSRPFGDIDQDDPAFRDAQAQCQDLLPGFGGFARGGGN